MTINLFALTGFGNNALKTLLKYKNVKIKKIYTRKEKGLFPYYEEEHLDSLALKNNLNIKYIENNNLWTIDDHVDINLIVTFHRIFDLNHLASGRFNINIHPSLLPSYKGPTPTNWMIHNKEKECGLSAHFLTTEIDNGDIIYQEAYPILEYEDNNLREFLASKVSSMINYLINSFPNYNIITTPYKESYYPSYYKGLK